MSNHHPNSRPQSSRHRGIDLPPTEVVDRIKIKPLRNIFYRVHDKWLLAKARKLIRDAYGAGLDKEGCWTTLEEFGRVLERFTNA